MGRVENQIFNNSPQVPISINPGISLNDESTFDWVIAFLEANKSLFVVKF